MEKTCQRCGKCCMLRNVDGSVIKPCKFLVKLKNGKTLCRIYKKRIGVKLDEGFWCGLRENSPFDFKDCPFNTDKKVIE